MRLIIKNQYLVNNHKHHKNIIYLLNTLFIYLLNTSIELKSVRMVRS